MTHQDRSDPFDAEERGDPRGLPRGDQLYDVREGLDDAGESSVAWQVQIQTQRRARAAFPENLPTERAGHFLGEDQAKHQGIWFIPGLDAQQGSARPRTRSHLELAWRRQLYRFRQQAGDREAQQASIAAEADLRGIMRDFEFHLLPACSRTGGLHHYSSLLRQVDQGGLLRGGTCLET